MGTNALRAHISHFHSPPAVEKAVVGHGAVHNFNISDLSALTVADVQDECEGVWSLWGSGQCGGVMNLWVFLLFQAKVAPGRWRGEGAALSW